MKTPTIEMAVEEEIKKTETEDVITDDEVADILFSLISVFNNICEIDGAIFSKTKQRQLSNWKNNIWRNINFYQNLLSQSLPDKKEEPDE